jgi:hypothetical protein
MYAKRLDFSLVDRDALVEQVRGYLAAKNTLALMSSIDAHISVTIPHPLNNAQSKLLPFYRPTSMQSMSDAFLTTQLQRSFQFGSATLTKS